MLVLDARFIVRRPAAHVVFVVGITWPILLNALRGGRCLGCNKRSEEVLWPEVGRHARRLRWVPIPLDLIAARPAAVAEDLWMTRRVPEGYAAIAGVDVVDLRA